MLEVDATGQRGHRELSKLQRSRRQSRSTSIRQVATRSLCRRRTALMQRKHIVSPGCAVRYSAVPDALVELSALVWRLTTALLVFVLTRRSAAVHYGTCYMRAHSSWIIARAFSG